MKIDLDNHELNITALSINYARMSGDVATLTIGLDIPAGWTEAAPIAPDFPSGLEHLDYVEFWQDGSKLMAGYVTEIKPVPCGRAWDVQYTISSALAMLAVVPYGPAWRGERLVGAAEAVKKVLAHAEAVSALDFVYEVSELDDVSAVAISSVTTCSAALQSLLQWCPHACVAMRYEASADVILVCTELSECVLDLCSGVLVGADGATIGCCDAAEAVSIVPRYDLRPPCVTVLHGPSSQSYGDASQKYAPHSLVYDVPVADVSTSETDVPLGVTAIASLKQKEVVKGYRLPLTAVFTANSMLSRGSSGWAWWRGIGAVPQLQRLSSDGLIWGGYHVTPIAGADAYPAEGDVSAVPANYQDPTSWTYMYLHISGAFLADVDSENCTPGLKFSRVIIEQNVYVLKDAALAGLSAEERDEWLCGSFSVDGDSADREYIYTTLRLEGTVINRARKSYYPLTGDLADDDDDYEAPSAEEDDEAGEDAADDATSTWLAVKCGAECYYNATRQLYYSGDVSLVDWQGSPAGLLCSSLSVTGGLLEWRAMESPITSVSYDPAHRTLAMSLGVAEFLTIDEYADRMATTRRIREAALAEAFADEEDDEDDEGSVDPDTSTDEEDDNGVQSIAASYAVNYSVACTAKRRRPWEIYSEGDVYYIEGGQLHSPAGLITVGRQVIAGYSKSKKYGIRLALGANGYEGRVSEL